MPVNPNEPYELVHLGSNILRGKPNNGCPLIGGLVRVHLSAIRADPILGQQPRLTNGLNQPIMVVHRTCALGIRGADLQSLGTAESGKNVRCRSSGRDWSNKPSRVNNAGHWSTLPFPLKTRGRKFKHDPVQTIGLPDLGKLHKLLGQLSIQCGIIANWLASLCQQVVPPVSSCLNLKEDG